MRRCSSADSNVSPSFVGSDSHSRRAGRKCLERGRDRELQRPKTVPLVTAYTFNTRQDDVSMSSNWFMRECNELF